MPVIINTLEELLEHKEFQEAYKLVLPRLKGYLENNVLRGVAVEPNIPHAAKGVYLEAFEDLLTALEELQNAKLAGNEDRPATPRRPKLHHSAFKQPTNKP